MFEISDSCLYCTAKLLFIIGSLMGHFPLAWKCTHNRKQQKVEVRISWILILGSLLHGALILTLGYYEFCNAFDTEKRIWETDNMSAITLLSFSVSCGITVIIMTLHSRYVRSLVATLDICLNLNYACDKEEVINKLYAIRRKGLLNLFIVAPGTASIFCGIINEQMNIYLVLLRAYVISVIIIAWRVYANMLISLSELSFDNLKKVLNAKRERLERNATVPDHPSLNTANVLKQLTITRLTNYYLIQSSNNYASPVGAMFLTLMLPFFYGSIYCAIVEFLKHGKNSPFAPMAWLYPIAVTQYIAQAYHQLIAMRDSFLSYLYRYPISRLSREERHQIETLIMVLKNQQHILRPSNMFNVSLRIAPSETQCLEQLNMICALQSGMRTIYSCIATLLTWINELFSGKTAVRVVAENESYGWGNLTLAVQLLLPLAFVALLFARKKVWIYPYPLLDTYISALCPSFSQQQRLLKWMSSRIPHMNSLPNKITQYWQNGSLLCTLINTVVPGACPNPQKHWKKPPTHGQALAYKYLGVTPVLAESDLNNQNLTSYSERKFIKYLLSLQDAINKVTIEEDTLKFTSRYVARGMGLVIGEQNRPSFFYVYPNTGSNRIENILVNIKGPYNTFGAQMISSSAAETNDVNKLIKIRKENLREQQKLAYKSKAQRSFFRSVSFDISPIMNLVTSRRNSGEIAVKVEMENDRAKVTFLPKFSGIYELLLTNDGQHLQGSPFIIRVMKSTKEVEDALQEKTKVNKGKIERKIISKSIDFINESVNITEEDSFKLDSNNNANTKDLKEATESNKSDDESSYQDSGVFDISESVNRSVRPIDLEEIDEDSRFSEISDTNTADESKYSSLEYKMADDKVENLDSNINGVIKFNSEETQEIIVHNRTPDDIKFLANDSEQQLHQISLESLPQPDVIVIATESEIPHEDLQNNVLNAKMEEDIFNDANDSESNQEFENLYNRIANDENTSDSATGIENLDSTQEKIAENETKSVSLNIVQDKEDTTVSESGNVRKIINNITDIVISNNLESFSNMSELQNEKEVTSSIERKVEIFEKESTTKLNKNEPIDAKRAPLDSETAYASPVFSNIAQEAIVPEESPAEDSARLLKEDYELSSKDERATLTRDYSICVDDDEIFNTNVKEIKRIFEKKPEIKAPNKRFATIWKKQSSLQETKNKLAKSMPNLSCDDGAKDSMEESFGEDEYLLKFKEKRNFWNNLISKNSQSSLNISNSEINLNNTKLISERYYNVSQSVNSLNTLPRSNKPSPLNKFRRKKEELHKANSLDLASTYDDEFHTDVKNNKIVRAQSLYDKIRIFDKDFDSSKHTTLLKRTKERFELKEIDKHPEIPKPESLTEVPNKTSNDQIEEDLHFAEIMKERFEISRRFFCSLEIINGKPNLTRRHSMDNKPQAPTELPLQKGGSLKMLNVSDKFAMDNIYKDVILNKIKNSSFRGSPNRDAVVETLSSVSSSESNDFVEKNKDLLEEEDLNLQFFNIRKRLRKRRSIKSIFDINY